MKQPSTALRSSVVRDDGLKGLVGQPRASKFRTVFVGSLSGGLFRPSHPTVDIASCVA